MLTAMLIMTFACWAYAIAMALVRVRSIIIEREKGAAWLAELAAPDRSQTHDGASANPRRAV